MIKIFSEFLLYFILSISFLFRKNQHELNIKNTTEIKAISAILIILCHCITATERNYFPFDCFGAGEFAVAVFFFLSGYGVAYGYKNKKNYVKGFLINRYIKLFIPFIIAHVFYLPINIFIEKNLSLKTLYYSFVGKETIVHHSWYCLVIALMYLIFWLCFKTKKSDHTKFILVTVSVIAFTIFEYFFYGEFHSYCFISNSAFIVGIAYLLFDMKRYKKYILILLSLAGIIAGIFLVPAASKIFGAYNYIFDAVSSNIQSAFFALLIITLIPVFQFNNRIASFIGKLSYEIYLYHGLFIFLLKDCEALKNKFLLFFILVCVLTIAFSIPMNYVNNFVENKLLKNKTRCYHA